MAEEHVSHFPTVGEILALPELLGGEPHILSGRTGLDREVRWAHVVAGSATGLLEGGELVLTTGAGWPKDDAELAAIATQLCTAGETGVSAVVWELGHDFHEVPAALITACEQHHIPLVALHHEVRFVQITQRVHQRILASQHVALTARTEVHEMLTNLGLNRSPADYIVEQLAVTLGAPVVLEDSLNRVVAVHALDSLLEETLAPWTSQPGHPPTFATSVNSETPSPSLTPLQNLPPSSAVYAESAALSHASPYVRVPVEAQGIRWGHLTALPGASHAAGPRTVLELGSFALALGRLADHGDDQWLQLTSKLMFARLLGGRFRNDVDLTTQLTASGFAVTARTFFSATLRGVGDFGSHEGLEHAHLETALRRAVAPEGSVLVSADPEHPGSLIALCSFPIAGASVPQSKTQAIPHSFTHSVAHHNARSAARHTTHPNQQIAEKLAKELDMLIPGTTPATWRAHLALSTPTNQPRQLITSLEQLRAVGALPASAEHARVTVHYAELQPLAHLMRSIAHLPEVQEFTARMLDPLFEHDNTRGNGHTGDLVKVLSSYLEHPTNRSLAAQQSRLSRSVFYQRIALIETLLGVDIAAGDTIAALRIALLARS